MSNQDLSLDELAAVTGGGERSDCIKGAVNRYLTAGGIQTTPGKLWGRLQYELDSTPGNFQRYDADIKSRVGSEQYNADMGKCLAIPGK